MAVTMPELNGELDVAYSSPDEFAAIALAWITEGVDVLAADISAEILAGPPVAQPYDSGVIDEADPRFAVRPPPLGGDIQILYPPRNKFYAKPYSRASLKRLTALAPQCREASVELRRMTDRGLSRYRLEVGREGEENGYARLLVLIPPVPGADVTADRPEIAYLKNVARRHAPAFGHVSRTGGVPAGETDLEHVLRRRVRDSLRDWDRYLRGYSWVTVVPAALAPRAGGPDGLRASGAFAVVEELAGGAVWLQATDRWSEYRADRVERVFEALAPVLPPGMPHKGRQGMPGAIDYLVSWRDAEALRPGGPGA